MPLIVELRVIPIGVGSSIGDYVCEAIEVLKRVSKKVHIGPMATTIELEDPIEVGTIVKMLIERMRELGAPRIGIDIRLDARFDKEISIDYKLKRIT